MKFFPQPASHTKGALDLYDEDYMDKGVLQKLVQLSFMKIVNSKHEHGGPKLLKNLLVLDLLQRVRRYFIYFYLFDYRQNTTQNKSSNFLL